MQKTERHWSRDLLRNQQSRWPVDPMDAAKALQSRLPFCGERRGACFQSLQFPVGEFKAAQHHDGKQGPCELEPGQQPSRVDVNQRMVHGRDCGPADWRSRNSRLHEVWRLFRWKLRIGLRNGCGLRLRSQLRSPVARLRLPYAERARSRECRLVGCSQSTRIRRCAGRERTSHEWSQKQRDDREQSHPQQPKASRRVQSRKQFEEEPHGHGQECPFPESVEERCHGQGDVVHLFPPCSLSAIIFLIRRNSAGRIVSSLSRFITSSSREPPKKRFTRCSSALRLASS